MSYIAAPKGTIVKTPWGDAFVTSTSVNVNVMLIDPKFGSAAGRSISESTLRQLNPHLPQRLMIPAWTDPYARRMDEWDARVAAARRQFTDRFDVV